MTKVLWEADNMVGQVLHVERSISAAEAMEDSGRTYGDFIKNSMYQAVWKQVAEMLGGGQALELHHQWLTASESQYSPLTDFALDVLVMPLTQVKPTDTQSDDKEEGEHHDHDDL